MAASYHHLPTYLVVEFSLKKLNFFNCPNCEKDVWYTFWVSIIFLSEALFVHNIMLQILKPRLNPTWCAVILFHSKFWLLFYNTVSLNKCLVDPVDQVSKKFWIMLEIMKSIFILPIQQIIQSYSACIGFSWATKAHVDWLKNNT